MNFKDTVTDLNQKELLENMERINNRLQKKVICEGVGVFLNLKEFKIHYEYQITKSISSAVADVANGEEPLPGYAIALSTMKLMEKSHFWISNELLDEKANGDLFVTIKVIKVEPSSKENLQSINFQKMFGDAVQNYKIAGVCFKEGNFLAAIELYRMWSKVIEDFFVVNDSQILKKKIYLKKTYQNWSLCCIKIYDPHQCRQVITSYRQISPVSENPKILFAKAKALMMFQQFPEAHKCLKAAEKLAPDDEVIKKTLIELKENEMKNTEIAKQKFIAGLDKFPYKYQSNDLPPAEEESLKPTRSMSVPTVLVHKSPINVLLELCTNKRFPVPVFTLCGIGQLFVYTCTLLNHRVKGIGKKKKLAKSNAAVYMLEVINSENCDEKVQKVH